MAQRVVEIPGVGVVEFPETMDDAAVDAAAAKLYQEAQQPPPVPVPPAPAPYDPIAAIEQGEAERTQSGGEFLKGIGKAAFGAVEGAGNILRQRFPSLARGPELQVPFTSQPQTPSEELGKTVGNIGMFFLPAGKLTQAKTALRTGKGLLDALVAAGLEGASAATVESAQRGSTDRALTTGLVSGGTSLGMQGALKTAGWLGERIERALVKPTTADVKNGFQVGNIFKYQLGGTLSQTFDKSDEKLTELSGKLQQTLARRTSGGQMPEVDVLQAITDAATDLQRGAASTFGQNTAINNAVTKLLDDPFFQQIQSGKVDLVTANKIKQAIGDLGAWLHDPSGRVMVDPDSKAMEVVANAVYGKLKTAIERGAQGDVAAINRQIAEIIPIRQAIIRRIPVDQRANVLNLGDLIGFSTGAWGIALANRTLRAGQTANVMATAGQQAERVAGPAARLAGGATADYANRK